MAQQQQQQQQQGGGALIQQGESLPFDRIHFQILDRETNQPKTVSGDEVFKGKRVALICIPGAFTPVCSSRHVPGYVTKQHELLSPGGGGKRGVDSIACLSTNDPFVMDAWARTFPPDTQVQFLSDASLDFANTTGLHVDLWGGRRLRRFSMLVEDGKVVALNVEPKNENLGVSSADHMLELLLHQEEITAGQHGGSA